MLTLSVLIPNTFVLPLSKTPVIPTRLPTPPPWVSTLHSSGRPHPVPGVRLPNGSLPGPVPVSGGPPVEPDPLAPSQCPLAPTLLTAGLSHPVLGLHSPDGSLSGPAPVSDVASDQSPPVAGVRSPDDSLSGPVPGYDVTAVQSLRSNFPNSNYCYR